MDTMTKMFAEEVYAHLEGLHTLIQRLKKTPTDKTVIEDMDDALHSMEGIALQVGQQEMAKLIWELKEMVKHSLQGRTMLSQGTIASLEVALEELKAKLDGYMKEQQ